MKNTRKQPSYRYHKARNCAVVTLNGKNHYLGEHGSPESHNRYAQLISEWRRTGSIRPDTAGLTQGTSKAASLLIDDLILAYFRFAQIHYVKNGEPTSEQGCLRQALRPLRKLYGKTEAEAFGPKALKDVRDSIVAEGRCRKSINKDIHRIKRMFRWAVEEELLPGDCYFRLRCVAGLMKGRTKAAESPGVGPVAIEHVEAVLPFLPPPVAAMVQLQFLTGCRPQEVTRLKPVEIRKIEGGMWHYVPASHKTEHHDRNRVIILGPKAQKILNPYLDRAPDTFCFKPTESVAWKIARRKKSNSELYASEKREMPHLNSNYDRNSYRIAIQRACLRAGIPKWSPNQLRHTRASEIRQRFGTIEAARAVLGHSDSRITEIYAERDLTLAETIMREIG